MPDKVFPGPITGSTPPIREAVCIHTKRIYDSCRDKECIEDLRVFPTRSSQEILDCATSVKCRRSELLWTQIDVQEVTFNRGFYSLDIKFFYRITAEATVCNNRPQEVCGLAVYEKRVILFGSDGTVRTFDSKTPCCPSDICCSNSNMPIGVVEALDPVCLHMKLVDPCSCPCPCETLCEVPKCVKDCFCDDLVVGGDCKRLYVTLGQFSIVRLERETQLLMPSFDFCVPDKECVGSNTDNTSPCDLFRKIKFPLDQFFPPNLCDFDTDSDSGGKCCGK